MCKRGCKWKGFYIVLKHLTTAWESGTTEGQNAKNFPVKAAQITVF